MLISQYVFSSKLSNIALLGYLENQVRVKYALYCQEYKW